MERRPRPGDAADENVFDYSLGNPSVPCPPQFTAACRDLLDNTDPVALHGYTPTLTLPEVRAAVAESLDRRFGMDYTAAHIFMTTGAAGALAHALRCVGAPGQNVVTFAPFFPEYKPYVEGAGLTLRVAPPRVEDFQIDFAALESLLDENTAAVLINSPNNPSGVAYSAATLTRLAEVLTAASRRYGHHIFLISDEPYREIAFGGVEIPYPARFYADTLTCYSFSKKPERARRAHRLRGRQPPLRGRGPHRAHVRADLPRDGAQLPVGAVPAGGGPLPGPDQRPFGVRDQHGTDLRRNSNAWASR